jgi:outer membrane protein OmpA-like peptidoglycan-associated protein
MSIGFSLRAIGMIAGAGTLSLLMGGCSATPPPELQRVAANYDQARRNPNISANAPVAWQEAERSLDRAESRWQHEGDENETAHLAYLAQRRLDIAKMRADARTAEKSIKDLEAQRDSLVLRTRTEEAEKARDQAERQRETAQIARDQAQKARREAEESQSEAARAREREMQLKQQLSELDAKLEQTNRGLVLTLGDVLFDFNEASLDPGAARQLSPLATFLKEHPERRVIIEGHTDSVGGDRYNQELSEHRAQAVRDVLVRNGVSPDRITTRGLGETLPIVSNDTVAGRQQNRRVEVIIANR